MSTILILSLKKYKMNTSAFCKLPNYAKLIRLGMCYTLEKG